MPEVEPLAVVPLFRKDTRASRIVFALVAGVPLIFMLIGALVPKQPSRPNKKDLTEVRFGEPSARPAP